MSPNLGHATLMIASVKLNYPNDEISGSSVIHSIHFKSLGKSTGTRNLFQSETKFRKISN